MVLKESPVQRVITALLIAAVILFGSILLVQQIQGSSFYQQSRFVKTIIQQDSIGVGEILSNKKNIRLTVKFAGAVTSAYINFELIPVNEANTFAVILESINADVTVDKFEYHRKNLTIDGYADSQDGYSRFLENLRGKRYFDSVSGDSYLTTEDTVRYKIVCVSSGA